jgi:hypothetical protein
MAFYSKTCLLFGADPLSVKAEVANARKTNAAPGKEGA